MTVSLDEARRRVAGELLTLASNDHEAMLILMQAKTIDFAIIGFHAQQSVEKAMKAVMAIAGITYPRSHDLVQLCDMLVATNISCPLSRDTLESLNPYAVSSRYNLETDELLNETQATNAVQTCLQWAQQKMNDAKHGN
jgi:HEPN domain-containing protein